MIGDRQPPAKPPTSEQPVSPDAATLPAPTSDNGAGDVAKTAVVAPRQRVPETRPEALQGRQIPSRNRRVRRLTLRLYEECHWLTAADLPAAVRWATFSERFRRMAQTLDKLPTVKAATAGNDGEPRRLDAELRATSAEMGRLESQLGLTASARASLGVDLTRMRHLDTAARVQRLRKARDDD